MAPSSRTSKGKGSVSKKATAAGSIPKPYRKIPDSLSSFVEILDPEHVYVAHVDSKLPAFKRKIFLVPVALNLAVFSLFVLRLRYIAPYYKQLALAAAGNHVTGISLDTAALSWTALSWIIFRRGFTLFLDLVLLIFVWPWPVEFCLGRTHGNPCLWRWQVGFRDKEVYVRRSREWDRQLAGRDVLTDQAPRSQLATYVRNATSPVLLNDKTGYLTMNGDWDLDWAAMVYAHKLVDAKALALDEFHLVVLLHHKEHGWLVLDTGSGVSGGSKEDERRRQVFAFREALVGLGKEDLFFCWIETVQFEATQPGGMTEEKQVAVAQKIRDLFQDEGINFDELWRESVGSDSLAGM